MRRNNICSKLDFITEFHNFQHLPLLIPVSTQINWPGSSVGIATELRAGRSMIESQ